MKLYHIKDYILTELPLAVWPVQRAGISNPHRHDCFELVFVTRGSGVCRINEVPYPVLRGDLYVLNPQDVHAYEMAPSCTFYNILFTRDLIPDEPVLRKLFEQWESRSIRKFYQFENEDTDEVDGIFTRITRELKNRRPGQTIMIKSLFASFLVKLLRIETETDDVSVQPNRHPEKASIVLEHIRRNIDKVITISELSRLAGMSTSAFSTAFRQWTGSSVANYHASLRIRHARELLEERKLPIGEIALRLGFYDNCHFSRVFRKATGLSPRQYQQLQCSLQ